MVSWLKGGSCVLVGDRPRRLGRLESSERGMRAVRTTVIFDNMTCGVKNYSPLPASCDRECGGWRPFVCPLSPCLLSGQRRGRALLCQSP